MLVTSNLAALLPMALKFLDKGLLDRLIVCEDDDWGAVNNPQLPLPENPAIVTFRNFTAGATSPTQWPEISADDVALLQYTGGTTGSPKGAMLSHGNLTSAVSIYNLWGAPARAGRNRIERVICVLPLFHIYAPTVILLSRISLGDTIFAASALRCQPRARRYREKRKPPYFPACPPCGSPSRPIRRWETRDLSSLVSAASGGAPLPDEVARLFERKTGLSLKSGWGMTETCSPGTSHPPGGLDKPGSIGLMLPGIDIDVVSLDDPTRVLGVNETGEIRIKGPNVTKGYWNRAQESAEVIRRRSLPHRRYRLHG